MIRRNLVANYFGQGWSALMGLAFVPLYIRFLGIEAYGLIGLYATLYAWLTLLDLGMSPTLGREMARFSAGSHSAHSVRQLLRSLEFVVFGLAALIMLLAWIGSGWLASRWLNIGTLPPAQVRDALVIIGLVIGLRFCEGIYRSGIIGLQQQIWFNYAQAALATLRHAGAALVVAFASPTVEAFFLWQAFVSAVTLAVLVTKLYKLLPRTDLRVRFSRQALRRIVHFAGGLLGINILAVLLTQVDKLILSRLISLEHFGYYALAGTISAGLQLLVAPIVQAVYPRLVALHERADEPGFVRLYHRSAQLVTLATAPVAVTLAVFPTGSLFVWSGDMGLATRTASIVVPLILGTLLNCINAMPLQAQLAHGWTGLALRTNAVAVLLLVPAILWFVPSRGVIAAAVIWLVLNLGYLLVMVQLMHRRILRGAARAWYLRDVLLPLSGAAVVVGLAALLIGDGAQMSRWAWLGWLALVVALSYGAAAWTTSYRTDVVRGARVLLTRSAA